MTNFLDVHAVQQLVAQFANSFDLKAWNDLAACLAGDLYTDYSDLRGTPPETMSRERFIDLRRAALENLKTHHLAGNVEVQVEGDRGEAKVSMVIFRRGAGGELFDTHCLYTLGVEKLDQRWLICSIVQKVLWSDGQQDVHLGVISNA